MKFEEMRDLLSLEDKTERQALYERAYSCKLAEVGEGVFYRGIVEFSNICQKDCYYCGIRKSNKAVKRYQMPDDEIIESGIWAFEKNYGSIVLQSGERKDKAFILSVEKILKALKKRSNGRLGITLSLGEQSEETYCRWFEAGAHRYLLRIETSDPELYCRYHPSNHRFEDRVAALKLLKKCGYQVGSGVMIGLPGQTIDNLVRDILFFKETDLDMIGMGPYIPHHATPLAEQSEKGKEADQRRFNLALNMIAVTRLVLKDVNIASTTALQALHPNGREMGIQAGANIIMPNITPVKYREAYKLYENKPCTDENASQCVNCLEGRIRLIGEKVGYGEWGDAPHFKKRHTAILSRK